MPKLRPDQTAKQTPIHRSVSIPVSELTCYEAAAFLLSELAFPEPDADAKRQAAREAICYAALMQAANDEHWAWSEQILRPAYICQPPDRVKLIIESVKRRLNHRLTVGLMSSIMLKQDIIYKGKIYKGKTDEIPLLAFIDEEKPIEYRRKNLSKNSVIDQIRSYAGQGYTSNFKSRIFKPSVPVLHLSIALDFYYEVDMGKCRNHSFWQHLLKEIMSEEHFTEVIINEAELSAIEMSNVPRLRNEVRQLTKFTLA